LRTNTKTKWGSDSIHRSEEELWIHKMKVRQGMITIDNTSMPKTVRGASLARGSGQTIDRQAALLGKAKYLSSRAQGIEFGQGEIARAGVVSQLVILITV
jgi:hypothetical protein